MKKALAVAAVAVSQAKTSKYQLRFMLEPWFLLASLVQDRSC